MSLQQTHGKTDKISPQEIKNHGNELFKQSKFNEAINQYTTALSHKVFAHDDDDLAVDTLLLKQSLYLMRGRAHFQIGKTCDAKEDFDSCTNILDSTKYAYKAKLVRSYVPIDSLQWWQATKRDLQTVINVRWCCKNCVMFKFYA